METVCIWDQNYRFYCSINQSILVWVPVTLLSMCVCNKNHLGNLFKISITALNPGILDERSWVDLKNVPHDKSFWYRGWHASLEKHCFIVCPVLYQIFPKLQAKSNTIPIHDELTALLALSLPNPSFMRFVKEKIKAKMAILFSYCSGFSSAWVLTMPKSFLCFF